MRILLIEPPWKRFFGGSNPLPPISLNSIASYFASMNTSHEIDVLNCDHSEEPAENIYAVDYASKNEQYIRRLNDLDDPVWIEARKKIEKFNPDVVGITSMTASYVSALNLARIVKKINPFIKVVMGGRHVSALPKESLQNDCVDVVIIGEGEVVFYDYIKAGANAQGINGTGFKDPTGNIVLNGREDKITELDSLPIPVFESKINNYQNLSNENWTIVGSRGCPFSCIYCADSQTKVRNRSIGHILDELITVKKRYGITNFNFGDDTFSLNKKRVLEFCKSVKELKLRIHWTINTRVDAIGETMLMEMRSAGCYALSIGIETGSEETMNRIKKKIDLKKVKQGILLAKKHGFITLGYFIIGFPWEKEDDMKKTVNFMPSIGLDSFQLNIATPLPGTELFRDLERQGKIVVQNLDWTRFFQGSTKMNFSDSFSDEEWVQLITKYLNIADRKIRRYSHKLVIKKIIKNPFLIMRVLSVSGFKRYILPLIRRR